jgi:hypothetical protein
MTWGNRFEINFEIMQNRMRKLNLVLGLRKEIIYSRKHKGEA